MDINAFIHSVEVSVILGLFGVILSALTTSERETKPRRKKTHQWLARR